MTTTYKPRRSIRRYTKKQRLADLQACVRMCMAVLYEKHGTDDKEMANLTGLSTSTLRRLALGEYSLAVRFGTVQAAAAAAGFKITLDGSDPHITLAVVE